MEVEYINGLPVDNLTLPEIVTSLPDLENQKGPITFISVNPQIAVHANKYPEVISLIENATHRIPDGIGIVKVSQKQKGIIKERVAGIDLMYELLAYSNTHRKRVFLYGAHPSVLPKTVDAIKKDYPDLIIAGSLHGYSSLEDKEIIELINKAETDMLFVALGFPKQEQWLAKHINELSAKFYQDVGGSFDVIGGTVKRAPKFLVKLNLEWLYRSLANPKRLYRIIELPIFILRSKKWYRENQRNDEKE